MNDKLRLGAAYHGNRMPHHAYNDLTDMVANQTTMPLKIHVLPGLKPVKRCRE